MQRLVIVTSTVLMLLATGAFGQLGTLEEARDLIRAGRAAEAVPILESLVAESRDIVPLRMNLAIALFTDGQYERAIEESEHVRRIQPNNVTALLFLGASNFRLGRAREAIGPLDMAVQLKPGERNARLMLGEAWLQVGEGANAVPHFEQLRGGLATNPRVWYGLERGYASIEEEAIEELRKLSSAQSYLHVLAGDRLLVQGFLGQAFMNYRRALAREPAPDGVRAGLAEVYRQSGREEWVQVVEEQARKPSCPAEELHCAFLAGDYRKIVEETVEATDRESVYWRAKAARKLEEEARKRLGELPASPQHYEVEARWNEERGSHGEAVEYWKRALEMAPDNAALQQGLAVSLHGHQDYEAALPLIERLLEGDSDSVSLLFLRGTALLNMGRAGEAIPDLEKAVRGDDGSAIYHGELGRAYLQAGRAAEAIPHLKAALVTDDDGSRHFQLARAYRAAGQREAASRAVREYQAFKKEAEERRAALEKEFEITAP